MNELDKALADIGAIRQQMAAGTLFRGLGPAVMAITGCLALATAALQASFGGVPGKELTQDPAGLLAVWVALAVVCAGLIGFEMRARTFRHHQGLADIMIVNAVDSFLPAGFAGAALGLVIVLFAPDTAWMLPGLWQVLVGIGLFAAQRFLPRTVSIAAAWYLLAGVTVLIFASQSRTLSPWAMGIPFGIGQLLLAALLHQAFGDENAETA